jgi:DTW domain-containing protein YfiP
MRLSCGKDHTEDEIVRAYKSIIGSRQTPHAGPGRPKVPRCKRCGKVPSRCRCKNDTSLAAGRTKLPTAKKRRAK